MNVVGLFSTRLIVRELWTGEEEWVGRSYISVLGYMYDP